MIIFLGLIAFVLFVITFPEKQTIPHIENGELKLSKWETQRNEVFTLQGEWEFYYNSFYDKGDLTLGEISPDLITRVPGRWVDNQMGGTSIPGEGYATFRLKVIAPGITGKLLGISGYSFPSASEIYIDDTLLVKAGQIAKTADWEIPELVHFTEYFTAPAETFDLIVHISNFHFARPGFWTNIHLGTQKSIYEFTSNQLIKEAILIGTIFTLCIVYLIFFFNEQKIRKHLYFSIICILIIFQVDFDGHMFIFDLLPTMDFQFWIAIGYQTIWLPYFVLLYLKEAFEIKKHKKIIQLVLLFTAIESLIFILLEPQISTSITTVSNIFSSLVILFAVYLIFPAMKTHPQTSTLYIFNLAILSLAFIYDYFLYYPNVLNLNIGSILPPAFGVMVFVQAIILSIDYAELHNTRREAIQRESASHLAFLQAQIKPHFLYNALSAIENVCHKDGEQAGELITSLSHYLRSSFEFNNLNRFTTLAHELDFIHHYIKIEQERFGERVRYKEEINVPLHTELPILILEPLIENAIRHGITPRIEGGLVKLRVSVIDEGIYYCVEDDGIGLSEEKQSNLFNEGENESGVGLKNIFQRLKNIYDGNVKFHYSSKKDRGTKIWFILPEKKGK
ncbi:MAG: histidine kinase [Anaerolineaceae bacterium]|nr:histidine kinase [Anaerolineaceae bacterium]